MRNDDRNGMWLDCASRRLPAFIVGGLLGGLLVGVLVDNIPYAVAGGMLIAPLAWFVFAGKRDVRKVRGTDTDG